MDNSMKLIDIVDDIFVVNGEMITSNGEDSFCYGVKDTTAVVAAFDGCGGLGARKYNEINNKTGAYLAARVVSGAVNDWHENLTDNHSKDAKALCAELVNYIMRGYANCNALVTEASFLMGSMVRDLPTTAAIAVVSKESDGLYLYSFWAGDSRVYIIDANGLAQITADDIEGEDAFTNLINDAPMRNVLSGDGKFELHCKKTKLNSPTTVFASTDGCFGYIPTPMEFEYVVENIAAESANAEELRNSYNEFFADCASDDYTLGVMNIGYGSYEAFRSNMEKHAANVKANYVDRITNREDMDAIFALWNEYKRNYERHLIGE